MTSLLDLSPVIPVVTVEDPAHAIPVARALVAGGLPVIELTLRTPRSMEALEAIADIKPCPQPELESKWRCYVMIVRELLAIGYPDHVSPHRYHLTE